MTPLTRIILAAGAALSLACGDDDGNGPNRNSLVGTWDATSMEFVLRTNPAVRVDVVAEFDATVTVVLDDDDTFSVLVQVPGEPAQLITGTWSVDGNTMTLNPDGEPFDWQFAVSLSGNTLTLEGGDVEFDVDDDGDEDECDLNLVLDRVL
ncbi:MAG TPA: lipocalin family protein [Gemmatimonadales bacterium]|nr:lipocalin family protein [Gemmatimonadales bacterium]